MGINQPQIQARNIAKSFTMGEEVVTVLKDVNLDVREGEFIAIEGRSGSGKSTLLHILGALDFPNSGYAQFESKPYSSLNPALSAFLRNEKFGFIFQAYHLLPELNVLENTLLPSMVKNSWLGFHKKKNELHAHAQEILYKVGLSHRLNHRASQLSGGERQRVAIARALMNDPAVLFADEPTGNLDVDTGLQIMKTLKTLHMDRKQTIIMVTHDRELAREEADRVLILKDGKLEQET